LKIAGTALDYQYLYIILNAILYVATFIIYQYRTKYFGSGSFLLLLYASAATTGILLYNNPLFSLLEELEIDVKLFSYLYLYIMLMIVSYPILRLEEKSITSIQRPSYEAFYAFCVIMIIIQLISAVINIPAAISNVSLMINDPTYGLTLYKSSVDSAQDVGRKGINIIGVLSGLFNEISVLLLLFYFTFEKKNILLFSGLILSAFLLPLVSISTGQRGETVRFIFEVIICFLIFKKFIPPKALKTAKITMICLFIMIIIPFSLIAFSRHGQDDLLLYSAESYIGQPLIKFSSHGLDAGGIRYGDRTATLFKMAVFSDTPRNYFERINKYSHMKMNEANFYTFVGDFTLDYGPVVTVLIFILCTLFFYRRIRLRQGRLLFHNVILIYILLYVTCCGIFLYPLAEIGGGIQLVAFMFFYLFFKIDYSFTMMKQRKNMPYSSH